MHSALPADPCPPAVLLRAAAALLLLLQAPVAQRPDPGRLEIDAALTGGDVLPRLDADGVWFDRLADATLWAASAHWKARFDARGLRFVPYLGSDAPRNQPVDLRLTRVRLGGEALGLTPAAAPRRDRDRVVLDHGSVQERFALRTEAIEQSFVFASLPRRDALQLDIAVELAAGLEARSDGDRLTFVGPRGGVGYGTATVFDAAGRSLPLRRSWTGEGIRIEVPARFVRSATLPLVVDPVIDPRPRIISANQRPDSHPDACHDPGTGAWLIVWQRDFSQTDGDVWSAEYRLTATGLKPVVGSLQPIQLGEASWVEPACANNAAHARNLIVAQTSPDGSSPWSIEGRLRRSNSNVLGAPLVIARAGVQGHVGGEKTNPDVGGDPAPNGPSYFTVVWEAQKPAPADRDIHAKQVTADSDDAALRTSAPLQVENGETLERNPSISKSCGHSDVVEGLWFVTYQRLFSSVDDDVRVAMISRDGRLLRATNIAVASTPDDERRPQVSSPSAPVPVLGGLRREAMIVFERAPRSTPQDSRVMCRVVRDDQTFATPVLPLSDQLGAPAGSAPRRPRIDSDGLRFALCWAEDSARGDPDVRASTVQRVGSGVSVSESRAPLATATSGELPWVLCAESRPPGAGLTSRYVGVWMDDRGSGFDGVTAAGYLGVRGGQGFSSFGQGCGSLTLSPGGDPVLGGTVTLALAGGSGGAAALLVGGRRPSPTTVCPGCDLLVDGVTLPAPLTLSVPTQPALVGVTVAAQGFALRSSGPCPVEFTDGLAIHVR